VICVHFQLCRLIDGHYNDVIEKYYIVDCRYPYEFEGGHIKNAINMHHSSSIIAKFLSGFSGSQLRQRTVIVFHCEFSQERGPAACVPLIYPTLWCLFVI
jgi:rhodanese-related sulfurtransferase